MKVLVLGITLLFAFASAQPQDAFDFEMASVILLQDKGIQREVKITEAQRGQMNKFADQHRAKMEAYRTQLEKAQKDRTKPLPVDPAKMDSMFLDMKRGVLTSLSAVQLRRLREISLQQVGFMALTDPKVAKKVGLSSAEQTKLRSTYEAGMKEAESIAKSAQAQLDVQLADLRKRKPKDKKEEEALMKQAQTKAQALEKKLDPQIEQVRQKTRKQVLSMLSAKQKASWDGLLGKPYRG